MLIHKGKQVMMFLESVFKPAFLDKKTALKVFVQGLFTSLLTIIIPLVFIPKIVEAIQNDLYMQAQNYAIFAIVIFTVVFLLRNYYMYDWYWPSNILFEKTLVKKYLKRVVEMDPLVFEQKGTGYSLTKFVTGIHALSNVSRSIIADAPPLAIIVLLSLFLSFGLGTLFGLFFVLFVVIDSLLIIHFYKKETQLIYPAIEIGNNISGDIGRVIMSKQEVLYSNKTEYEATSILEKQQSAFTVESNAFRFSIRRMNYAWLAPQFLLLLFFVLQAAGVFSFSFPEIMLVVLLIGALTSAVESVFNLVGVFFDNYKNIIAFYEMMDQPQISGYTAGKDFVHKDGQISIKEVNFGYEEEKMILRDFSLDISGGTKIALVGRSGSGKTTIAKLITGYMRPTSGQVIIDDQDLSGVALKTYYPYVGYLTQEPMVFDGSIRDNLLYGVTDTEMADEALLDALSRAECQFVQQMKDGLDTQIGEKGIRLSGGERQRLAIAKLLLKNPEIVVLDEPTSALDSFSEEAVTRALDELFKDRTVIIIAHRLQTVKRADKILVLDKGNIVEQGTHRELVDKGGEYARMLEMQSGF